MARMKREALVLAACLTALIGTTPAAFEPNLPAETGGHTETIAPSRPALRASGGAGFAPYHFTDENGLAQGFDVDLLRALGRVTGRSVVIQLSPWEESRGALERGELDLVVGLVYSKERARTLRYTTPTLTLQYRAFARESVPSFERVEELEGRVVAVQRMGVAETALREAGLEETIALVDSARAGMELLRAGSADYFVTAEYRGLHVLQEIGAGEEIRRVGPPLLTSSYGIAAPLDRAALIRELNGALAILERSGEYRRIHQRWFGMLEPDVQRRTLLLRWGTGIVTFLALALLAVLLWLRALRRQVAQRTAELERELASREAIEAALRESEERFSKAFRHSPEIMVIASLPTGHVLEVNEAFVEKAGYPREEAVGKTALELGFWADLGEREQALQELLTKRQYIAADVGFRRRDGEVRRCECSMSRIVVAGQSCMLAIVADVTERRELEEQLEQSRKLEALGQLAGGVAHDFNNILTAIQGHAELGKIALDEDGDNGAHLDEILAASSRAADLTAQMLAFSRRQVLQPEPVEVGTVVREMLGMLRRLAGESIQLETELEGGLWVMVDPAQLGQVLINLVANARDAQEGSGSIQLRLRGEEGAVILEVEDAGCGVAPEIQGRLFEPFFTTKERGRGTGLGLSTVYGIVEQSHGHVEVVSEPGAGALFRVRLPAVTDSRAEIPSAVAEAAQPAPGGGELVLVVEDQEDLCRLMAELLESQGYRVEAVSDSQQALLTLARGELLPALIVTDVIMPKIGGVELAERARSLRPSQRVLFVSGYTDREAIDTLIGEPGIAFLQKPFTCAQLSAAARQLLDVSLRSA